MQNGMALHTARIALRGNTKKEPDPCRARLIIAAHSRQGSIPSVYSRTFLTCDGVFQRERNVALESMPRINFASQSLSL